MRKYYTRPCNFYYGNKAKDLIANRKALPLNSRKDIAFDQIEVFQRRKKSKTARSKTYSTKDIKHLDKQIKKDVKNIILKRKGILGLKFDTPQIMGALNITPDSFSDGGLFFEETKAHNQMSFMINSGATIIDVGGESTRPGSTTIDEKKEWKRISNTIIKFKKNFPKII